jgi:hypothetical protein
MVLSPFAKVLGMKEGTQSRTMKMDAT